MTKPCRIFIISFLSMGVLLFSACKKNPVESTDKEYFTGALKHDVPQYLYKSTTYTFTVFGITKPAEGLTYKWGAVGFSPDSCFTQSFTCKAPDQTGT